MSTDRDNESNISLDELVEEIDRSPFKCSCQNERVQHGGLEGCQPPSVGLDFEKSMSPSRIFRISEKAIDQYRIYCYTPKWKNFGDETIAEPAEASLTKCHIFFLHNVLPLFDHVSLLFLNVVNETCPSCSLVSSVTDKDEFGPKIQVLPEAESSNMQNELPKTPAASSAIAKVSFKFENGATIVIVNYHLNSGDIYARYAGEEHDMNYKDVLNTIALAGITAPTLINIPSKDSIFFLKNDDGYHRARLVRRLPESGIRVHLIDWGKIMDVDTPDMKDMDSTHAQLPCYIHRISLVGSEIFREYEPCDKIDNFMKQATKKETPFILTYEENMYPFVKLICAETGKDINRFVSENTMPIFELFQRDNIKACDLPVTMLDNINTINLMEFKDFPKPITLKLRNVSELPYRQIITCSRFDDFMELKIAVLFRQINEYCLAQPENYLPMEGEMCLVLKEEKWLRAVAIDQKENGVIAFLVDEGSALFVPMTSIKKFVPYFMENVPALACLCKIKDIPEDSPIKVWERVVEMLIKKSHINVMSIDEIDGDYLVSIPDVVEVLKSENFL